MTVTRNIDQIVARLSDAERLVFERRVEKLRPLAEERAEKAPHSIRDGERTEVYLRRPVSERMEFVRTAALADLLAGRLHVPGSDLPPTAPGLNVLPRRIVSPRRAAPSPSPVTEPSAPARYFVACASPNCENTVPAPGPRPVLLYCEIDRAKFEARVAKREWPQPYSSAA